MPNELKIGDRVYASDWFYGTIIDIEGDTAWCEFGTGSGGVALSFKLEELRKADDE